MRLWKVVLLVDLALAVGLVAGYLWWAREVRTLRVDLERARQAVAQPSGADDSWTADGIFRAALPHLGAALITHGRIPGLMTGMTMGFETEDPSLLRSLTPGDRVRFTLRQEGSRLLLVGIEKEAR
ncbi:MAG: copper-binding protein [Candidatus Rokuibacteriota bacterium]